MSRPTIARTTRRLCGSRLPGSHAVDQRAVAQNRNPVGDTNDLVQPRNTNFRNSLRILRHKEYAGLLGFKNTSNSKVATVQTQSSAEAARGIDAGQDLNQCRLPSSILAEDGMHLAAVNGYRDAAKRMSAAEVLVELLDLEERPGGLAVGSG